MNDVLMKHVLLGISSNDQARTRLLDAVQQLSGLSDICCLSSCYLNNAAYLSTSASPSASSNLKPDKSPQYINAVLLISTSLNLLALTTSLKQIEASAEGVRANGICPLDLDIVAFEGETSEVLKSKDAYLWACIQEICPQLQSELPIPEVWQQQVWPEFVVWQVPSQAVSDSVARLFGIA